MISLRYLIGININRVIDLIDSARQLPEIAPGVAGGFEARTGLVEV